MPIKPDENARSTAMVIAGVDLTELAHRRGPFTSLYLNGGMQPRERAHLALDRAGAPGLHRFLDALDEKEQMGSRALFAAAEGPVVVLTIEEPLRFDVARAGDVLSLGTLIEYSQFSAPHAVVTIEDDMFGITSFGSVEVPETDVGPVSVSQSVHTAIDQLTFLEPNVLALVGAERQLERYSASFSEAFPHAWVQHYATDDIDAQLLDISDSIVRDAQSRAAESLTNELAQFRAARDLGRAVEGDEVLGALQRSEVETVFVHDDTADERRLDGDRLVDHITHRSVRDRIAIRMIPNLGEGRGPAGGLGAIVKEAASVVTAEQPSAATASTRPTPSVAS